MVTDRTYQEQLKVTLRDRIVPILRRCELFTELDNHQLETIGELAWEQEVVEQEYLFRRGERASNLAIVVEGSIALQVTIATDISTLQILGTHGIAGITACCAEDTVVV